MAVCSNCKKTLSCGCQKRKASDGASVCTNCITAYEKKSSVIKRSVTPPAAIDRAPECTPEEMESAIKRWSVFRNRFNK